MRFGMFYVLVCNEKFLRDWKMHLMSGSQALSLICVPLAMLIDSCLSLPSLCAIIWLPGKFLKMCQQCLKSDMIRWMYPDRLQHSTGMCCRETSEPQCNIVPLNMFWVSQKLYSNSFFFFFFPISRQTWKQWLKEPPVL